MSIQFLDWRKKNDAYLNELVHFNPPPEIAPRIKSKFTGLDYEGRPGELSMPHISVYRLPNILCHPWAKNWDKNSDPRITKKEKSKKVNMTNFDTWQKDSLHQDFTNFANLTFAKVTAYRKYLPMPVLCPPLTIFRTKTPAN